MCKWGTNRTLRVPIDAETSYTGKFRWDDKPIDSCISDLVDALNAAGIYTGGSCCGHGKEFGTIALHDGRVLVLKHMRDFENCAGKFWE